MWVDVVALQQRNTRLAIRRSSAIRRSTLSWPPHGVGDQESESEVAGAPPLLPHSFTSRFTPKLANEIIRGKVFNVAARFPMMWPPDGRYAPTFDTEAFIRAVRDM